MKQYKYEIFIFVKLFFLNITYIFSDICLDCLTFLFFTSYLPPKIYHKLIIYDDIF